MKSHLLILDLDQTLIHGSVTKLEHNYDMVLREWFIYFRPFCRTFLRECQQSFDVAIWTASTSNYAIPIITQLFQNYPPPSFIFTIEQCNKYITGDGDILITKSLERVTNLGYSLSRVLIVDDRPETYSDNYSNGIPILPFTGDMVDSELLFIQPYLEALSLVNDIREVNKEKWRHPQGYTNKFLTGVPLIEEVSELSPIMEE
jgi:TFIIF-interacting CTD phosphatase-like protein